MKFLIKGTLIGLLLSPSILYAQAASKIRPTDPLKFDVNDVTAADAQAKIYTVKVGSNAATVEAIASCVASTPNAQGPVFTCTTVRNMGQIGNSTAVNVNFTATVTVKEQFVDGTFTTESTIANCSWRFPKNPSDPVFNIRFF